MRITVWHSLMKLNVIHIGETTAQEHKNGQGLTQQPCLSQLRNYQQPNYTRKWMSKLCHSPTVECHTAVKWITTTKCDHRILETILNEKLQIEEQ